MTTPSRISPRLASAQAARERVIADPYFEQLTAEAAAAVGASHAQITIVADEVTAAAGGSPALKGRSFPLEEALCTVAVRSEDTLVAPDATADARLSSIEAVQRGLVRSYAGVPVRVPPEDHLVAVLCVYDPTPHGWSDEQIDTLASYAAKVSAALESR